MVIFMVFFKFSCFLFFVSHPQPHPHPHPHPHPQPQPQPNVLSAPAVWAWLPEQDPT